MSSGPKGGDGGGKSPSKGKNSKKAAPKSAKSSSGRTFVCMCGQRLTSSYNLRRHQRTHTGQKDHECTRCDKGFYRKDDLVKHMRTHTGVQPFQCSVCKRRFSDQSNRSRHMRRIHPEFDMATVRKQRKPKRGARAKGARGRAKRKLGQTTRRGAQQPQSEPASPGKNKRTKSLPAVSTTLATSHPARAGQTAVRRSARANKGKRRRLRDSSRTPEHAQPGKTQIGSPRSSPSLSAVLKTPAMAPASVSSSPPVSSGCVGQYRTSTLVVPTAINASDIDSKTAAAFYAGQASSLSSLVFNWRNIVTPTSIGSTPPHSASASRSHTSGSSTPGPRQGPALSPYNYLNFPGTNGFMHNGMTSPLMLSPHMPGFTSIRSPSGAVRIPGSPTRGPPATMLVPQSAVAQSTIPRRAGSLDTTALRDTHVRPTAFKAATAVKSPLTTKSESAGVSQDHTKAALTMPSSPSATSLLGGVAAIPAKPAKPAKPDGGAHLAASVLASAKAVATEQAAPAALDSSTEVASDQLLRRLQAGRQRIQNTIEPLRREQLNAALKGGSAQQ